MNVQQVKFRPIGEEEFFGGIMVDGNYIICGCCGGVFEMDDVAEWEKLEWVAISDEILGE